MSVFLRAPHNYDVLAVSMENSFDCNVHPDTGEILPSLTQQQFKDDADINVIVERFGLTGELPENFRAPISGDFTGVSDYQSALNAVMAAQEEFMTLPAMVRKEFDHDPQKLMEFVADSKNRDRAIELGLIPKPVERPRDVVAAVDELAAKLVPKS